MPDFFEPNDSFPGAANIGTLTDATYSGLNIHTANNDDYYRFTSGANGTLNLTLSFLHSQGDIDVSLLDAAGSVITSSTSTTNTEFISWPLVRGTTYGIRVYGYQGATNPSYTMTLDGPDIPLDSYEANDEFGSAYNLGSFTYLFAPDLTIHATGNADFYRFTSPGTGLGNVDLGFAHIDGDIDVALYTDTGTFIASSTSTSNAEHINFNAVAGQSYVAQVYGYAGARTWDYEMGIIMPADTTAPTVVSDYFAYDYPPQELRFSFSENVSASLSASDLVLQDLTHGGTVPTAKISVSYDFGSNTAIFKFPGFANGVLPAARYFATINAGSVADQWGNVLAANHTKAFSYIPGDADGNGLVNFDDYARIDAGFNQGLIGFSNGDFNNDGVVNFDDYAIIDLAFNTQ